MSSIKKADPTTIQRKVMVGYQGWFTCAGDGPPLPGHNGWLHWVDRPLSEGGRPNFDLFPDVSAYSPEELYPIPGLTLPSGEPARLFSSRNPRTVRRHFNWMAQHAIDGVFLQRFAGQLEVDGRYEGGNVNIMRLRDEIGQRVREAAEAEGRVFAIMYDVTGVPADQIERIIRIDWERQVKHYRVLDSPSYLREAGKPVVALWGFGFDNRGHHPEMVSSLIRFIRYITPGGAYVMGGVPTHWRTLRGDQDPNPAWLQVYKNDFDAISPWTVGRYGMNNVDAFAIENIREDIRELRTCSRHVDYIPTIFPGGSGHNMSGGKLVLNDTPRHGGKFFWRQIYNAKKEGCNILYIAMMDEYDEGTNLLPAVVSSKDLPRERRFIALDVDGVHDLPSDWYLRIACIAGETIRGDRRLEEELPRKELIYDYWSSRPKYAKDEELGQGGSSSASGGSSAAASQPWNALDAEDKDEPPPPPYTLEAMAASAAAPATGPATTPAAQTQQPQQSQQPQSSAQRPPSSPSVQSTANQPWGSPHNNPITQVQQSEGGLHRHSSASAAQTRPNFSQQPYGGASGLGRHQSASVLQGRPGGSPYPGGVGALTDQMSGLNVAAPNTAGGLYAGGVHTQTPGSPTASSATSFFNAGPGASSYPGMTQQQPHGPSAPPQGPVRRPTGEGEQPSSYPGMAPHPTSPGFSPSQTPAPGGRPTTGGPPGGSSYPGMSPQPNTTGFSPSQSPAPGGRPSPGGPPGGGSSYPGMAPHPNAPGFAPPQTPGHGGRPTSPGTSTSSYPGMGQPTNQGFSPSQTPAPGGRPPTGGPPNNTASYPGMVPSGGQGYQLPGPGGRPTSAGGGGSSYPGMAPSSNQGVPPSQAPAPGRRPSSDNAGPTASSYAGMTQHPPANAPPPGASPSAYPGMTTSTGGPSAGPFTSSYAGMTTSNGPSPTQSPRPAQNTPLPGPAGGPPPSSYAGMTPSPTFTPPAQSPGLGSSYPGISQPSSPFNAPPSSQPHYGTSPNAPPSGPGYTGGYFGGPHGRPGPAPAGTDSTQPKPTDTGAAGPKPWEQMQPPPSHPSRPGRQNTLGQQSSTGAPPQGQGAPPSTSAQPPVPGQGPSYGQPFVPPTPEGGAQQPYGAPNTNAPFGNGPPGGPLNAGGPGFPSGPGVFHPPTPPAGWTSYAGGNTYDGGQAPFAHPGQPSPWGGGPSSYSQAPPGQFPSPSFGGGPSPPLPPRPQEGVSMPTPNQNASPWSSSAWMHHVDNIAGEDRRKQIEQSVGQLAKAGQKWIGKFTK